MKAKPRRREEGPHRLADGSRRSVPHAPPPRAGRRMCARARWLWLPPWSSSWSSGRARARELRARAPHRPGEKDRDCRGGGRAGGGRRASEEGWTRKAQGARRSGACCVTVPRWGLLVVVAAGRSLRRTASTPGGERRGRRRPVSLRRGINFYTSSKITQWYSMEYTHHLL